MTYGVTTDIGGNDRDARRVDINFGAIVGERRENIIDIDSANSECSWGTAWTGLGDREIGISGSDLVTFE
jgi:hypothetical protein